MIPSVTDAVFLEEPLFDKLSDKGEGEIGLSYLFRLQALVSRMTEQLSRLSAESQKNMATKKKEYRIASKDSVGYIEAQSKTSGFESGMGMTLFVAQLYFTSYAEPLRAMSGQLQPTSSLFIQHWRAGETQKQAVSTLCNTDIGNEGAKQGDTVSISTILGEISRALHEILRSASRS